MASEARFADIQRLLNQNGWTLIRISGSHHVFFKKGGGTLSIPVHRGQVKPVYVRQVERAIRGEGGTSGSAV